MESAEEKQLHGREITAEDFYVRQTDADAVQWMDNLFEDGEGGWNIELETSLKSSVDEMLGTAVETDANSDYLNIYINLRANLMEIEDCVQVTLCKEDGTDEYFTRPLSEKEQFALLCIAQNAMHDALLDMLNSTKKSYAGR